MTRTSNVLLVALVAGAAVFAMLSGESGRANFGRANDSSGSNGLSAPSPSLVVAPNSLAPRVLTATVGGDTPGRDLIAAAPARPRTEFRDEIRVAQAAVRDDRTSSDAMPVPFGHVRTTGTTAQAPATDARQRLTRSIQVELQRVGCYAGPIDGDWGQASQRAMHDFNERINATLPIHHPDYILLTLLQGHAKQACGAPCPRGQIAAANGNCQPQSVAAEARRQSKDAPPVNRAAQSEPEPVAAWARTMAGTAAPAVRSEVHAPPPSSTNSPPAQTATVAASATSNRQALAEAERTRINAIQQRKRHQAAEVQARIEGQRLAQLFESEKARAFAEVRRREELAALDARRKAQAARSPMPPGRGAPAEVVARVIDPSRPPVGDPASPPEPPANTPVTTTASIDVRPHASSKIVDATKAHGRTATSLQSATTPNTATTTSAVTTGTAVVRSRSPGPSAKSPGPSEWVVAATPSPSLPATPLAPVGPIGPSPFAPSSIAAGPIVAGPHAFGPTAAAPAPPSSSSQRLASSGSRRFVGRFIPPPTYRVGRLPPRVKPARLPVGRTYAALRRPSPQRVFGQVQHHAP